MRTEPETSAVRRYFRAVHPMGHKCLSQTVRLQMLGELVFDRKKKLLDLFNLGKILCTLFSFSDACTTKSQQCL